MRTTSLLALLAALSLGGSATAQEKTATPTFKKPVRLTAGEKGMGEKRLYPSPVFRDMNGDGLADVVIGDLPGSITVALRVPGPGAPVFGAETKLKAADGRDLKFNNW